MILKADRYYMNLAFAIAKGSKCVRAYYGSLIVAADGRRIIATAVNGKPAHSLCDHLCFREGLPPNAAKVNCCIHSEVNCLLFSNSLDRLGGTMYVSGVPCCDCLLVIMNAGLARLVYFAGTTDSGHKGNSDDDFWQRYGVPIERVPYTHAEWETLYG